MQFFTVFLLVYFSFLCFHDVDHLVVSANEEDFAEHDYDIDNYFNTLSAEHPLTLQEEEKQPTEDEIHDMYDPDHALLIASEHGNVTKIKRALERGAHMGTRNNFAVTPLIFASNNGHIEAAKHLLDLGAEIDAFSNNGRTPLLWACFWGLLRLSNFSYCVELL